MKIVRNFSFAPPKILMFPVLTYLSRKPAQTFHYIRNPNYATRNGIFFNWTELLYVKYIVQSARAVNFSTRIGNNCNEKQDRAEQSGEKKDPRSDYNQREGERIDGRIYRNEKRGTIDRPEPQVPQNFYFLSFRVGNNRSIYLADWTMHAMQIFPHEARREKNIEFLKNVNANL